MARLREAVIRAPVAHRLVISSEPSQDVAEPPAREGRGGEYEVTVLAVPVTDTCKEVVDGLVRRTIPRDTLVDARGPWTFQRDALMLALDRLGTGAQISSLIELCQAARLRVRVLIAQ